MSDEKVLARIREHGREELVELRKIASSPLERQMRENAERRRRQDEERQERNADVLARSRKGNDAS